MTLIEAARTTLLRLHSSPRTEKAYVHWIRAFIRFHEGRHPREMGAIEATAFLNHLAVQRRTSASTQNQALSALVFLYRRALDSEMPDREGLERDRRPAHPPAVLSRHEVLHRPATPRPSPTGKNNTSLPASLPHSRGGMRR